MLSESPCLHVDVCVDVVLDTGCVFVVLEVLTLAFALALALALTLELELPLALTLTPELLLLLFPFVGTALPDMIVPVKQTRRWCCHAGARWCTGGSCWNGFSLFLHREIIYSFINRRCRGIIIGPTHSFLRLSASLQLPENRQMGPVGRFVPAASVCSCCYRQCQERPCASKQTTGHHVRKGRPWCNKDPVLAALPCYKHRTWHE